MARFRPVRKTGRGAAVQLTIGDLTLYRTKGGAVFLKGEGVNGVWASEGQFIGYLCDELERLRRFGERKRA